MKILMVTTELAPFAKAGGLGDMVSALSLALAQKGHDVRIVCPLYGCIHPKEDWIAHPAPLVVQLGGHKAYGKIWETTLPQSSAKVYFIEHHRYFHRPEIYGGYGLNLENDFRFTFLARAALDCCYALDWIPHAIHAHDWPGGLLPAYLNTVEKDRPLGQAGSVFTIHNMKHQGRFHPGILDYAGLPKELFQSHGMECFGSVNFLKSGLYHSRKLTTVSPSYAKEIQTPEFGCGLESVIQYRAADMIGILNGIDTDDWNPAKDPRLASPYTPKKLSGKKDCKRDLQAKMGLNIDPHVLLLGVVARMDLQKGLDLIAALIPWMMETLHVQVAILGAGDQHMEHLFLELGYRYPGRLGIHIGYDNPLSHQIEAGADAFLMPSRFEPCGLNQMYSMRYGTPPIVRSTGGLKDTVFPYRPQSPIENATGFTFGNATSEALRDTIGLACATYYDRPEDFKRLQQNGMLQDFSWEHSATLYEAVYEWAKVETDA
jgi:starch synthase